MDEDVEGPAPYGAILEEDQNFEKSLSWRALFNFTTRAHIIPLLTAIVLSIASGIVIPILSILLGKLFNQFTEYGIGKIDGHDLVHKISSYALCLVGLGSGAIFLNACYFGFWLVYGELQAKNARDKLFDGLLEKDMEWFDMRKTGIVTLLDRLQMHVRELQMSTSQPLSFTVQYTVTTIAALGLALFYAWDLTLIVFIAVPFAAVILGKISARMQPGIKSHVEALTKASKLANVAITAIDTIKCYNGQEYEIWQYSRATQETAAFYLKQAHSNALQIGFVRCITLGMFVQGFWYGTHLVNTGKKNAGDVLTAFWSCLMATQTIEQILPQMLVLEKGRAAGATLQAILKQMKNGREAVTIAGGKTPDYCDGDIVVKNVSFRYPSRPDQTVLDNTSFSFSAGEITWIIGRSGSGKSTIGNLLLLYYKPSSGGITLDERPMEALDIPWLRNNITLIQQQSVLFNETLLKNIAFGRRDHEQVRRDDVKPSLRTAYLQYTINELPEGLDTMVGTGGSALSGGQRQRVTIARAHLRNTPVLIIDEGTSALDHVSRTAVMNALRQWRKGKTTILITHDMSQIKDNEFVYVMEAGKIVQEGFRHALEKTSGGAFQRLLQPEVTFPLPSNPIRRSSNPFDDKFVSPHSSRRSIDSIDSMDISYRPRLRKIPSVFGPSPKGVESRRLSPGLISPLSPTAFPMNRITLMSPTLTRQGRSESQRRETVQFLETPPADDMDTFNFGLSGPSKAARSISAKQRQYRNSEMTLGLVSPASRRGSVPGISRTSTASAAMLKTESKPKEERNMQRIAPIKEILYTIWPTLSLRKRAALISGFGCATLHAVATPLFSWVFAKLLGTFFLPPNERSRMALRWSLSVLGIAVSDAVASYYMHYLLECCGQAWIDTLRVKALKRILDQPREWFDRDQSDLTELTECLDRNAEEMRNLLGRFAAFVFIAVIMLIIAIVWSLSLCWKLTLVGLASAPFMYAVTQAFETVSGRWESRSNHAGAVASSIFTEMFGQIRTVRSLTLEGYFHRKYLKATDRALRVGMKRSALSGLFFGVSESGIIFITALIFYYGAVLASSKDFSVQEILTVFTMLLFSIANATNVIAFIPQIGSSQDTATRLLRLANLPYQRSHEHDGNIRLPSLGPIRLKDVSFAYPTRPSPSVLTSLSLSIDPASSTALVGSSGCGKSTIASLLLGLYAPTSGSIIISSFRLRALHLPTLRDFIAVIPQSPTLFAATVAENIAYALPEKSPLATIGSIRAAAVAAGIDDFIMSLPRCYNTPIGDGGSGLSGGQAQRLAIARAIVRRPHLLIMDEATSGLDGESARGVYALVRRLKDVGIGCLVVTHSTEMMKACRQCVVLGGGRVLESGRFEELISRKGGELRSLIGG